jgi:hypothetical protein
VTGSSASAISAASRFTDRGLLGLVPAAVGRCKKSEVVNVTWNLTSLAPASTAEILVRSKNGPWVLFAAVQGVGRKATGPWMVAGAELMMRNKATKAELARILVGSLPCAQSRTDAPSIQHARAGNTRLFKATRIARV